MSEKQSIPYQAGEILEENISFEELMARYEGQPVEFVHGKVIVKVPNNQRHQLVMGFLYILLSAYLGFTKLGKVFLDGYQMQLDDEKTPRQPDLLVVLEKHYSRLEKTRVNGAADLVIEIISPATGKADRGEKFYEYQNGGVPEYWIIDPETEEVLIYVLDEKGLYKRDTETSSKIVSHILPRFILDAKILWQESLPELPEAVEIVKEMLNADA